MVSVDCDHRSYRIDRGLAGDKEESGVRNRFASSETLATTRARAGHCFSAHIVFRPPMMSVGIGVASA